MNWIRIVWAFLFDNRKELLITLIGTFLGVWGAFKCDKMSQEESDRAIIASSIVALTAETATNLIHCSEIRRGYTDTGISMQTMSTTVANQMMNDPLVYQYTADEFQLSLRVMLDRLDNYNRNAAFVIRRYEINRGNIAANLQFIEKSLDDAEYRILIMQKVLDYYHEVFGNRHKIARWSEEIIKLQNTRNVKESLSELRDRNTTTN